MHSQSGSRRRRHLNPGHLHHLEETPQTLVAIPLPLPKAPGHQETRALVSLGSGVPSFEHFVENKLYDVTVCVLLLSLNVTFSKLHPRRNTQSLHVGGIGESGTARP